MLGFVLLLVMLAAIVALITVTCASCGSKPDSPVVITEKRTRGGRSGHQRSNKSRQERIPLTNQQPTLSPVQKKKKQPADGGSVHAKFVVVKNVGGTQTLASKEMATPKPGLALSSEQDSIKDTVSSIKSTGSGYYAALMKQMKVKSVSQYNISRPR